MTYVKTHALYNKHARPPPHRLQPLLASIQNVYDAAKVGESRRTIRISFVVIPDDCKSFAYWRPFVYSISFFVSVRIWWFTLDRNKQTGVK